MGNGKRAAGKPDTSKTSNQTTDNVPPNGERNGEPPVKRSRVSRACDQCRASREKCDGSQPKCATCTSQSRDCSYNEQPKKRGIQPNYIRTLELTVAWLFLAFPDAEALLSRHLPKDEERAHRIIGGKDPAASEALHNAWRESLVNKQIDQMLSGASIDRDGQKVGEYSQLGADAMVTPHPSYQSPPLSTGQSGLVHFSSDAEPSNGTSLLRTSVVSPQEVPTLARLPENASTLLEYYFAFTHSWLPMMEKHSNLKLMYSYPAEGLEISQMKGAEHVELWSILAVAATQVLDDTHQEEVLRIQQVAQTLIPMGDAKYEVAHIKALLLLGLVDIHNERIFAAWLRVGTAVRILSLFKLLEKIGQSTDFCRHVHLVAFVLESALALRLGAVAHLTPRYVEGIGLVTEDGLDEWITWHDPLDSPQRGMLVGTPARSFSTLNELARIYMRCVHAAASEQSSEEADIVFSLAQNAARKSHRIQPSVLVANMSNLNSQPRNDAQESHPVALTEISGMEMGHVMASTPAQQYQSNTLPTVEQRHPFMSIPNETAEYDVQNSPVFSNAGQSVQMAGSMPQSGPFPPPGVGVSFGDDSAGASNIFEEFDAMLERHDTNDQSQFLQNLGFAPDLDLAEFFGPDYQPSDPLLAYVQPMMTGKS